MPVEHQAAYCLQPEHLTCSFYLEPPLLPRPVIRAEAQDDVGTLPRRAAALRILLWGLVVLIFLAVVYYFYSALLTPLPAEGAAGTAGRDPTSSTAMGPASSATPTSSRAGPAAPSTEATSAPGFDFVEPTGTPTPYPGGAIYSLSPKAGTGGWVASHESQRNHLGDSYLYSGIFDGAVYHGFFQFDLAAIPRGSSIYAATLELTGLDDRRLGSAGVWEVRILPRESDDGWDATTFQTMHNAPAQWSIAPALGPGDLQAGKANVFQIPEEVLRDWEQRLIDLHETVSFRLDGPLTGENSLFAWASGAGDDKKAYRPRLLLNVGPPPLTPYPTGSPPPTSTPDWIVVTSTPTPGNIVTAAAIAVRQTAWATTTGTPTGTPPYVVTATPAHIVVTRTPTPGNAATAVYANAVATACAVLTGTPTPTPPNLATATFTPRPTNTPVLIWLDELDGTPEPAVTPTPTPAPIPDVLKGKIVFLSDRTGEESVFVLDPASGRVGLLTDRWPYEQAHERENRSSDGQAWAYVDRDDQHTYQVHVYSQYYGGSWQVTHNTGMSYDPVWMPGGDKLAFVSTENGNDDIYVIGADGTGQERLTVNDWEWDKHPSWSPDGRQIVFWSNAGTGRRQIWIVNADGTGRRLLLNSSSNDWDPVWIK